MNGALASFARRRAISVLPQPVGPIMRMFLGVISWRSGSSICMRRQRLRSAMATERLAESWPMMCLSSSATISFGVIGCLSALELFDHEIAIGVDADVGSDVQRLFDDVAGRQFSVLGQRARRRLCEWSAGANGHEIVLGLDDVAVA